MAEDMQSESLKMPSKARRAVAETKELRNQFGQVKKQRVFMKKRMKLI
jgi:hypothetical protein